MKCQYCGREIPDDSQLCPYCGQSVQSVSSAKPQEKKKKKRAGLLLAAVATVAAVCLCVFLLADTGDRTDNGSGRERQSYYVRYEVTGTTSRASLTYENESENTEQRVVEVPWEMTFYATEGQFLYVSAQNELAQGSIECKITVNDEVVESASSEGSYVIASCSGSVR
jgi:predicted nucleic acid-binding Zn ribbon protein